MLLVIIDHISTTCLFCIRASPAGAILSAKVRALILTALLVIDPRLIGSRLQCILNLQRENSLLH